MSGPTRSSLPRPIQEIDPNEELEKLIPEVFASIPEQERKEVKLGNNLELKPITFDFNRLCDPYDTEYAASYSLYAKKVVYEALLFTQKHNLHLKINSSNNWISKKIGEIKKVGTLLNIATNAEDREHVPLMTECLRTLDSYPYMPLIVDFESYHLCKQLMAFISALNKNHVDAEKIEKALTLLKKRISHYEEKSLHQDKEYKNIPSCQAHHLEKKTYFNIVELKKNLTGLITTTTQYMDVDIIKIIDMPIDSKTSPTVFYAEKISDFLNNIDEDTCNYIEKHLMELERDAKHVDSQRELDDSFENIHDIINIARKFLSPTQDANIIKTLLNTINELDKPLIIKKQFATQIAAIFIPKITSFKEIAKLAELLNKQDFLREERGSLEKCFSPYGDTQSFKFVLTLMQQQIRKLINDHSKEIADLNSDEKYNINQIMNYKKRIFSPRFDINHYHFKSFVENLQIRYPHYKICFFQQNRMKDSQKNLLIKNIPNAETRYKMRLKGYIL